MPTKSLSVEGVIQNVHFRETRFGKLFAQVRVSSGGHTVQVDVFSPPFVAQLRGAQKGDRLAASGPGFHRGPIRGGSTSITARRIQYRSDPEGRQRHAPAVQLDMFAA